MDSTDRIQIKTPYEDIMDPKKLFLKTSPLRLFFLTALPGAISMLASAMYGIFDGVFVGNIVGDTAFAAINLAFPFVILNYALSDLIAVGSAVPISIALGKKEDQRANHIFSAAVIMILVTGLAMGLFLYAASPLFMRLLGAEGELASLAVSYVRVYACFSPLTTMTFAVDNYLRISGKIKYSMFLNIGMSLGTIALEFVFLFYLKLGIVGAALASCLSMVAMVIIAMTPFLMRKFQLKFTRPTFSKALVGQIISCGSPAFLSNIAGRITSIVMNAALLSTGGESAVSIWGILMYVGETIQPIVYGMCDSLSPAIGYNYGAGYYRRVKTLTRYIYTASAVISIAAALLMLLIPDVLISLFTKNQDTSFLREATLALRIYALSRFAVWFSFATQIYMTAVDKPLFATVISLASSLVIPVALVFLLSSQGLTGLWLNPTLTAFTTSLLALVLLMRFQKKMPKEDKPLPSQSE